MVTTESIKKKIIFRFLKTSGYIFKINTYNSFYKMYSLSNTIIIDFRKYVFIMVYLYPPLSPPPNDHTVLPSLDRAIVCELPQETSPTLLISFTKVGMLRLLLSPWPEESRKNYFLFVKIPILVCNSSKVLQKPYKLCSHHRRQFLPTFWKEICS